MRQFLLCLATFILLLGRGNAQAPSTPPTESNEEIYAFHEEPAGHDSVQISIENPKLQRGQWYSIEYCFHAWKGGNEVYNGFFEMLRTHPGQLAVYDADRKYLGDAINDNMHGSHIGTSSGDWFYLREGNYIGAKISFMLGGSGNVPIELPPGKYYLQLILYKAFFSIPPASDGPMPTMSDAYSSSGFNRYPAARSNVLEVELSDP